jgi:hypothetical protein
MQCPKCGSEQPDGGAICSRCGIVYEKYFKYHPRPGDPVAAPVARSPTFARPIGDRSERPVEEAQGLGALLLPATQGGDWLGLGARGVLWAVLLVWGLALMLASVASNAVGQSFLHLINLPFHEFGHILFRPFGAFVTSLGGTLGQLMMPAICAAVLLIKTRDPFGASACLWWLGENFLDIAPYIDDARAGQLPLLGGNFGESSPYGFHDWEYLLGETGLSHLDHAIARGSHVLGSLIMLLALGWGAWLLVRHYRQLQTQG